MKIPEPRKLKSGSWFIQLRLGGESIPVTERTRADCLKQAQHIKAAYLADRSVQRKNPMPGEDQTLEQLLSGYIKRYSAVLSPSTVYGYRNLKNKRFLSVQQLPLREIDFQAAVNAEAAACSPKTLRNAWGFVAAALKDAGQQVPEVKLPQPIPKPRPWLTAEEIRTFVGAVRGDRYEIPILLGLHGLRRSEIMALDWRQIDLAAGVIHVEGAVVQGADGKYTRKAAGKTPSSRRPVPIMVPELRAALEAVPQAERTGPVVSCNIGTIYKATNRICRKAGLPQIGAHGLRHSMASLGRRLGVPEHEMQRLGGWSDSATMRKIYQHIDDADMLRATNAMAEFYAEKPAAEHAEASENANKNSSDRAID